MATEANATAQPTGDAGKDAGESSSGGAPTGTSAAAAPLPAGATQTSIAAPPPAVAVAQISAAGTPPPIGATQLSTAVAPPPVGGTQPQLLVTQGAYEFKEPAVEGEEFNIRLKAGHARPVPADQAKLAKDIYETKNILKLLNSEGRLGTKPNNHSTYREFITRVKEVASAGCIGPDVETALAADALAQIRADVLRRIGRPVAFRYLHFLALWGLAGALIGIAVEAAEAGVSYWSSIESMGHYGLVLVGAMAGSWFGVAVRRWQIAFEELPGFLDVSYEPLIRMVFVAVVALVFALFLDLDVLNVKLGNVDLAGFIRGDKRVGTALLLGFIAGMSERVVSKQLADQVGKALPQS